MRAFSEDLSGYPTEKITAAFVKWRKTKSVMPTPADILVILKGDDEPVQFSYPDYPDSPDVNDWKVMTPEQRADFEGFMKKIYQCI